MNFDFPNVPEKNDQSHPLALLLALLALKSTVRLSQKCPLPQVRQQSPTVGPVVGTLHSKAFSLPMNRMNKKGQESTFLVSLILGAFIVS